MEKLLVESREPLHSKEFCQKMAKSFRYKAGLQPDSTSKVPSFTDTPENQSPMPAETCPLNNGHQTSQNFEGVDSQAGEKTPDLSELKFEAKSSKDGACYDVDIFVTHRFLSSGEVVRFVGYGAEDDEWVNVKKEVRERSIPFEHSECNQVAIGNLVLCLQERRDQPVYYDAHVLKIDRKMHDIRGCRCLFVIRYNHDNSEASILCSC
ncbi:Protein SAWADEE [Hibiscus syriacus]|uniref:Protein SAWADEE n=1 Tax=Hibiscus syriacus TaxID=106335 RepID=A0A6A2WEP9_HIBSY|nr:Protein SAWADEE [Hibiscus syriacus]